MRVIATFSPVPTVDKYGTAHFAGHHPRYGWLHRWYGGRVHNERLVPHERTAYEISAWPYGRDRVWRN